MLCARLVGMSTEQLTPGVMVSDTLHQSEDSTLLFRLPEGKTWNDGFGAISIWCRTMVGVRSRVR